MCLCAATLSQEIFIKVGPVEILGQHEMCMKSYFQSPKIRALFTMQACGASRTAVLARARRLRCSRVRP